jgi:hypothetical protein
MDALRYIENAMSTNTKRIRLALAGACWGAVLAGCSALAAGAGHGVYFPAALVSAPFGVLGVAAALLGAVLLWAGFGAFADRRINAVLLLFHYAGIVIVYFAAAEYRDFEYFFRLSVDTRAVTCTAIALYTVGQIWIVLTTIKAFMMSNHAAPASR